MIARSLAKFLRGNVAISGAAHSILPQRLYSDHSDPAIVYAIGEDLTERTIDGSSSLKRSECSVDCLSLSYDSAQALAEIVNTELHNYAGAFGDVIAERIDETGRDDIFESEIKTHSVMLNYEIWYTVP